MRRAHPPHGGRVALQLRRHRLDACRRRQQLAQLRVQPLPALRGRRPPVASPAGRHATRVRVGDQKRSAITVYPSVGSRAICAQAGEPGDANSRW